ncbi:MAG: anion permease [Acidobacteriia bacterium]|nr:anion permease [Terriglobia bacterium]
MTTFQGHQDGGLRNSRARILVFSLALVLTIALWFYPSSIQPDARHALAVSLLVLIMWVARILPHAITGLIGCYLFWTVVRVPSSTAFGGFTNISAWFVFATGLFGLMMTKTRLAHRLAGWLMGRSGLSYSRLVLSFLLTSLLLNFLVPSGIARVIILAGIGLGVVSSRGWGPEDLPARGLFVALTFSSTLFDKLMITGGSTIVAQGIIEKVGRASVYWSQWFFAMFPALVVSLLACWLVIVWLFPADPLKSGSSQGPSGAGQRQREAWGSVEKRCAILLVAALLLWVTDFIHHIHPAVVALGIALVATLPRIGVLEPEDLKQINFLPFIFTASALSLGDGLMKTGALAVVTQALTFCWGPWAYSFLPSAIVLYWTSFSYHLLVPSDPTTLATSMPTVMNFALAHHWNPVAAGLVWTLALTGKIFVYQSGATIAGFSFGYFQARDFLKVGLCLAVVEFLVLLILLVWYWPLIGLIRY